MSVNVNLTKAQKIDLVKSAMTRKAGASADAKKPEYLKMTGSIFNAPNAQKTNSKDNLTDTNVLRSLNDLNKDENKTRGTKSKSESQDYASIDNAADGKKAAAEMEGKVDNVKSQTARTQKDAKTVTKFGTDAQKQQEQIQNDDKKFVQQLKRDEAEFKKDNKNIEKLTKEMNEDQKEVEKAQKELDTLLATNSFSINNGTSNSNQDKIDELQTIIGSKVGSLQQNGKKVYSLQRSQTKTIKRMNKTNVRYVKTQKVNQQQIQATQKEEKGIIKVANTIDQISQMVQMGGQALNLAGDGLIALASATFFSPATAAALVATGTVMKKVGTVAEMVGQYGSAAANITKTAAYAADGNLMGAMQSAVAAAQSGAAAVKSTKGLKAEFGNINAKANDATKAIAANEQAKQAVEDAKNKALKDNATSEQLQKFTDKDGNIDYKGLNKDYKKAGVNTDELAFGKDANGNVISQKQAQKATSAQIQNSNTVTTRTNKYAQLADNRNDLKGTGEAAFAEAKKSNFSNTAVKTTAKTATKAGGSSFSLGNISAAGLSMFGNMFGGQQQAQLPSRTTQRKAAYYYDINSDARMQRIVAKNNRHRGYATSFM